MYIKKENYASIGKATVILYILSILIFVFANKSRAFFYAILYICKYIFSVIHYLWIQFRVILKFEKSNVNFRIKIRIFVNYL